LSYNSGVGEREAKTECSAVQPKSGVLPHSTVWALRPREPEPPKPNFETPGSGLRFLRDDKHPWPGLAAPIFFSISEALDRSNF